MKFNFLEGRFGEEPLFQIKQDETAIIRKHYQNFIDPEIYCLDDITWNDLDLDRMYEKINGTLSGAGDIMLYGMLRQPCHTPDDLQKRLKIMEWAKKEGEEREQVLDILYQTGKRFKDDFDLPLFHNHGNTKRLRTSQAFSLIFLLSFIPIVFMPFSYILVPIILCIANIFRYWVLHKQLEHDLDPLVYIIAHVEVLHRLANTSLTGLDEFTQELVEISGRLKHIRKKASLGYYESSAGIFNCFTQGESILFDRFASKVFDESITIRKAFALIGELDACICAASYQIHEKMFINIELKPNSRFSIAKKMVHPLVEKCVANDIDIRENRLLTGSNATGKSTYLKMVVLNAVLAQSFHMVFAQSYEAGYFKIATSMSIHDNLERNESTFVAEVKSLKHLLDLGQGEVPALCVIDEILRGTNTLERIAASSIILQEFCERNALCLGATHDIELTRILRNEYQNYHFSETLKDEKMIFDYKIHKGPTTTRNAILLLKMFSYDSSLVNNAQRRLKQFEANGEWEVIA